MAVPTGPFTAVPDIIPVVVPPVPICPVEAFSMFTSACISVMVTPDLFIAVLFTNAVIAAPRPVVPAVDDIIEPPIIPPPMVMAEPAIFPSITPSEASFAMAVTMPEEFGITMVFAYWDIAAMAIP